MRNCRCCDSDCEAKHRHHSCRRLGLKPTDANISKIENAFWIVSLQRELAVPTTRTDLALEIVDAYGKVLPNLQRHGKGWPTAEAIQARVVFRRDKRQMRFSETHGKEERRGFQFPQRLDGLPLKVR